MSTKTPQGPLPTFTESTAVEIAVIESVDPSLGPLAGGWEDGLEVDLLRRRRRAGWRPSELRASLKRWLAKGLEHLGWRLIRVPQLGSERDRGVDPAWLAETHHGAYGRPWCLGRDQVEFLLSRGLQPHHRVLDFGCGSLRAGVWLIHYLAPQRYYGLDAHRPSLEVGLGYEIPLHGLSPKRPRLLHSRRFEVDHFQTQFDWVMAFSVFNHLTTEQCEEAIERLVANLAPEGRLITSHGPPLDEELLRERHKLHRTHHAVWPCRMVDDSIEWFEYRRVAEDDGRDTTDD